MLFFLSFIFSYHKIKTKYDLYLQKGIFGWKAYKGVGEEEERNQKEGGAKVIWKLNVKISEASM